MDVIAKKYVQALFQVFSIEELEDVLCVLSNISDALGKKQITDLIYSPFLTTKQKEELLLHLFETIDERLKNFFKIIVLENRIQVLQNITDMLEKRLLAQKKQFVAVLQTKDGLDSKTQDMIAESLSRKLNVVLNIKQEQVMIEGIRLSVDDLGIEISFSKEKFLSDLSAYILKAF